MAHRAVPRVDTTSGRPISSGPIVVRTSFATLMAGLVLSLPPTVLRGQTLSLPAVDVERLQAYHARIANLASGLRRSSSVSQLLGPLMALAETRSGDGDAMAENRAVLLALAFYVNDRPLTILAPEARDWPQARRRALRLAGRQDLAEHLTLSAAIAAAAGRPLSNLIGLFKELDDARRGGGFSFTDLAADRSGAALGRFATLSEGAAREMQARLGAGMTDEQLLPDLSHLPDRLSSDEFRQRYGGTGAGAYQELIEDIDRRIAALALFRTLER